MAFNIQAAKEIPVKSKSNRSVNHNTIWAVVSFNGNTPRLLVDGVYYDATFTFEIYMKLKYLISNVDNDAHPQYTVCKINSYLVEDRFPFVTRWWTYLIDGMKVRVDKIGNTYAVNIDLLNNKLKTKIMK